MKTRHPLIQTLVDLKGNARACVFTEPLWGVPYYLFAPFASLYMQALGVKDQQIGMVASIGLLIQIISSMFSGIVTDKLGRRPVVFFFDILCWVFPYALYMIAQNVWFFIIASMLQALMRIPTNAWNCLMVEDTDQKQLVHIFAWVYISGYCAAFFAPIAGALIGQYSLVPVMRILYGFAFVTMTIKCFVLYYKTRETTQGIRRKEETKGVSVLKLLGQYKGVFGILFRSRFMLITLGIMLVMHIVGMINSTFWALMVTSKLNIPESNIGLFTLVRSGIALLYFFTLMPRLSKHSYKVPMFTGFCLFAVSQTLLILIPGDLPSLPTLLLLGASLVMEATAICSISPLMDSMWAIRVDPQERARITAIIYTVMVACASPFGWIAGAMSSVNRILPFFLNIGLLAMGAVLIVLYASAEKKELAAKTE